MPSQTIFRNARAEVANRRILCATMAMAGAVVYVIIVDGIPLLTHRIYVYDGMSYSHRV